MDREEFLNQILEAEETLFHVAFSILHQQQDCADAVQEAILKAYARKEKLRKPEYFKTWITRILINECYNLLRKNRKYCMLEDEREPSDWQQSDFVKEEYLDLYGAIERLNEGEKLCILLFYMEDYSVSQIAQVLRIPEGTVKSRLNRARKNLKGFLQE